MAVGYTRQEAANITTGNTIEDTHFNNEYNAIVDAMHATTGHNHDGTTGGGAPISMTSSVTGTLPVANGGTGLATITDGGILLGSGTSAVTVTSQPTNGQLLIGYTSQDPVLATLTAGTGISITNGTGTITIATSGTTVTSVSTDSGSVTPSSNTITLAGGSGISTSGSSATATVAISAGGVTLSHLATATKIQSFIIACSDETSNLSTGTAKATFRMPYAFTITDVRASVTTAPTGAAIQVDINESGTTILSTKITIDATEKTSTTAATPAVISDASLADDAEITIDIDQVGSTITGAGLKVTLIGYKTS